MHEPLGEIECLSETLTPRFYRQQQTARGILENTGKCTASHLMLKRSRCDVLITEKDAHALKVRSPLD